jgi:REP element-mobilizing transposase RayT
MTFSTEEDRQTYLQLLRASLSDTEVRLLGWCLMSNHVHLVAIPGRQESLAILLRRVHGDMRNTTTRAAGAQDIFGRIAFLPAV